MDFEVLKERQRWIAQQARYEPLARKVELVAGVDVAYIPASERALAAAVVFRWPDLQILEERILEGRVSYPYVPGYLSFREVPLLKEVLLSLKRKPDLVFVDGQGRAHPRQAGLAVHLGVELQWPTIGCAKKPLLKVEEFPEDYPGACRPIYLAGEVVGYVLRTRQKVKPIYVSPGHLLTAEEALEYTLKALRGYRLPEPLRRAHLLSLKGRREYAR